MKPSTARVPLLFIAPAFLAISQPVYATDRHWNVASGVWTASANWSPTGVPAPADDVFVDYFAAGHGGSVSIGTTTVNAVTSVTVLNGDTVSMLDGRSGGVGSILCGTDFVIGTSSTSGTLN